MPLTPSPRMPSMRRCAIPARSTLLWWTPIWRAGRSIIWWDLRCRRYCGANFPARARRDGCSRWRSGSFPTARPRSRSLNRRNTGPSRQNWPPAKRKCSKAGSWPSTVRNWVSSICPMKPQRCRSGPHSITVNTRSRASNPNRRTVTRRRHLQLPRYSRRPRASCASMPGKP